MELFILIAIPATIVVVAIIANNQIVVRKNQVAQAFGSIEIFLKKRFDLIPNLVAMLNKYMAYEKELLTDITRLRSQLRQEANPSDKIAATNELNKLLTSINLNAENYPDLKADMQFHNLQYELRDIEDHISAARRAYNAAVTAFNNKIEMFPANIIANLRKEHPAVLLEIPKAEQKELDINQLLNS